MDNFYFLQWLLCNYAQYSFMSYFLNYNLRGFPTIKKKKQVALFLSSTLLSPMSSFSIYIISSFILYIISF